MHDRKRSRKKSSVPLCHRETAYRSEREHTIDLVSQKFAKSRNPATRTTAEKGFCAIMGFVETSPAAGSREKVKKAHRIF